MGKASRVARKNEVRRARRNDPTESTRATTAKVVPAPFVGRPFEGLPSESDWVALREIVPAATATVRLRPDAVEVVRAAQGRAEDPITVLPAEVTITTVLPMAWPAIHRADGVHFVALQSVASSGDASRDLALALLAVAAAPVGEPVTAIGQAAASTPRLQELLDVDAPFDVSVRDGFDYWIADDVTLDEEAAAALAQANESIIPTVKMAAAPSAYWCRVGARTHLRWILPGDEDAATAALARLHARAALAGQDGLGAGTRFLGAFRAGGLLAPVWDLDPALEADAYEAALTQLVPRYQRTLADDSPLSADERRARAGLISRQLTLR
ncbi:MAG: DUF5926 family protein [Micrococcales bacterium]|nr:DUF5926 family protein [Micrococcales bacterium]